MVWVVEVQEWHHQISLSTLMALHSETCHEDSLNKTVWGKPLNRRNTELLDSDTLKINKAKLAQPIGMYSWVRPLSMQLQFDH